jgi:hypothetical protein
MTYPNINKVILLSFLLSAQNQIAAAFSITSAGSISSSSRATNHAIAFHRIGSCPTTSSSTEAVAVTATTLFSTPDDDANKENNEEGMSLAADFFKTLQSRNIQLDDEDLLDDDDDDEEDDDDEIDDVENVDDVTLSDDQVYSELNERVLETAGGFVELTSGASEDDEEDAKPKVYEPPETVPDPALTAGEVVTVVLDALNNNDVPTADRGVEILFGYSSSGSAISQAIQVEGMTPAEYGLFLKEEYEYKVLFNHSELMIEKGDYSFDRKKAFFTARLSSVEDPSDVTNVNFILSTEGQGEDDCWLIDSLLIRPKGMRRRRRR